MKSLPFEIEPKTLRASVDAAYLSAEEEDNLNGALLTAVIQNIHIDVEVTVSGVTMFLAAWEDPQHWADDWAEKLGVDLDDAPDAVAGILADAVLEHG